MRDISCPSCLEAAEAVPPRIPTTRAGKHHPPIRAGIDTINVINDMHKEARLTFFLCVSVLSATAASGTTDEVGDNDP